MQTAVRTQEFRTANTEALNTKEPKRLSKAGQWMRDNPDGVIEVIDWRAVNK